MAATPYALGAESFSRAARNVLLAEHSASSSASSTVARLAEQVLQFFASWLLKICARARAEGAGRQVSAILLRHQDAAAAREQVRRSHLADAGWACSRVLRLPHSLRHQPLRSWFSSHLAHTGQYPPELREVEGAGVYLAKEPPGELPASADDPVRDCTWHDGVRAGFVVGAPNAAPAGAAAVPGDELGWRTFHMAVYSGVHMLSGEKDKRRTLARWGEVTHVDTIDITGPVLDVMRFQDCDETIAIVALTDISQDRWEEKGVVVDVLQSGKQGITNAEILHQVGR